MCMRLYGPMWVRSMSDEGQREQMACWSCMNTFTHPSLPGLFFFSATLLIVSHSSLTSVPHNPEAFSIRTTYSMTPNTTLAPGDLSVRLNIYSSVLISWCMIGQTFPILSERGCVVRALLDRISSHDSPHTRAAAGQHSIVTIQSDKQKNSNVPISSFLLVFLSSSVELNEPSYFSSLCVLCKNKAIYPPTPPPHHPFLPPLPHFPSPLPTHPVIVKRASPV